MDVTDLSRTALARLGREYLLAGHLIDRASMPQLLMHASPDVMTQVAIDQWMGASPIYTQRMQRALAFEGDDVPTIFKGLQFDVGAPHQFMDFRFRVEDRWSGEFWLDHCGALMDVEPMGEDFVRAMCHDIEDPTFDATAVATNPRAQIRPIHRPPRVPADRSPHCHWTVRIRDDHPPVAEAPICGVVRTSLAATIELAPGDGPDDDGRNDYRGDLDPDLQLEAFSTRALRTILDEVALQGHLLVRAFTHAADVHVDPDVAAACLRGQFRGIAPVVADRLRRAMAADLEGLEAVRAVLALHPAFRPRAYTSLTLEVRDGSLRAAIPADVPALAEGDGRSWTAALVDTPDLLAPVVEAVAATARCAAADPADGEAVAWDIVLDPAAVEADVPNEVLVTRVSTGAEFQLRDPLPLAEMAG